jgi:hypothetical protein
MPTFDERKREAEIEGTRAVHAFRKGLDFWFNIAIALVFVGAVIWWVVGWLSQ